MWMASCTRRARGGFWIKSLSWVLPRRKKVDFCLYAEARPVALWRVPHVLVGGDGKVCIERLCLSPYVEKPFNSKVIKSFVPELWSRKCFSCFGIHVFYVYMLWTSYVRFTYSCVGMLQYMLLPVAWELEWRTSGFHVRVYVKPELSSSVADERICEYIPKNSFASNLTMQQSGWFRSFLWFPIS